MSHNSVQLGYERQQVCRPPEDIETHIQEAASELEEVNDSIQEGPWVDVPILRNPNVTVDLKANHNDSGTLQSVSRQPSQEQIETPVFSPRVLLPFKSLSLLESPSDIERPVISGVDRAVVEEKTGKKGPVIKEEVLTGFFFPNVNTPKPFLPLSPLKSDGTWSDSETSPANLVWQNMENDLESELAEKVEQEGYMKYIKQLESPISETSFEEKAPKIDILKQVERQTPGSSGNTPYSGTDISELQPFDVRPELLCGFDSISKLESPIHKEKGESGNLSTYIEKRDSLLKGLVADGGTRDFALWFERLGPGLHCNQDFHTETGTFEQDFWHNPFARSKSFDRYLGLTGED